MVTSKRVKIARFPHATCSPSTHSCLVPHPFVVIENVVEESLAYSPLLKRNMRVMAKFLPIVYRTMRWFGLKSRWHFTVTQALCSKVLVSQAFWKVRVYIYIILLIFTFNAPDIIFPATPFQGQNKVQVKDLSAWGNCTLGIPWLSVLLNHPTWVSPLHWSLSCGVSNGPPNRPATASNWEDAPSDQLN